jgi:redox-sensitive bicupin YhaK (pirin superfamily)
VLTQDLQRRLDPFLMLDAFGSDDPDDYIARLSRPSAPRLRDRDLHAGRPHAPPRQRRPRGPAGADGGVQWMTAGRGVIHSEMPEQNDGRMEGFQLWLNLPGATRCATPWYRDIQSAEMPEWQGPASPRA